MLLFSGQKVVAGNWFIPQLFIHIPFAFSQQCVSWLVLFVRLFV